MSSHRSPGQRRHVTAWTLALLGLALQGQAVAAPLNDLMADWQAAQSHDPSGRALLAAHDAGLAAADQARALWRPQVLVGANLGWGAQQQRMDGARFQAPGMPASSDVSFASQVRSGLAQGWSVTAQQPLWSRDREAMSQGLRVQAEASDAAWRSGRQQWLLTVVQAHLQVLAARARVASLDAEMAAVQRSHGEAQARFDAGKAPIAAVLDAQARLDALTAQQAAVQAAGTQADAAYADLTGLPARDVAPLRMDGAPITPTDADLPPAADWRRSPDAAEAAIDQHPLMAQARLAAQQADTEAHRWGVWQGSSLDVVARAADDRLRGHGPGATAGEDARMLQSQRFVGLQLQVPFDLGGGRSAREREAQARLMQAQAQLDALALQLRQQARQAWWDEHSARARVQALQAARRSAQERLDATRTGVDVGDRTMNDLLRAQADLAAVDLDRQLARQQALMASLQLAAACGALDDSALQIANTHLDADARVAPQPDHP